MSLIRDIFDFVKRVYEYAPILWHDRDWDHDYILWLLQYKLSRVRKELSKNDRHLGTQGYVAQIRLCEALLERILKSEYWEDQIRKIMDEQGDIVWIDQNNGSSRLSHTIELTGKEYDSHVKRFRAAIEHAEYLEKQDIALLFTTMRKHIRHWWD